MPTLEEAGKERCSANTGNPFLQIPELSPSMHSLHPPSQDELKMPLLKTTEVEDGAFKDHKLPEGVKSGKYIKVAKVISSLKR